MHSEGYTTHSISKNEFQFFSEGKAGRFELRIYVTLIDPDENLYNLGFGIWDPVSLLLDDTRELRNGDTDKILATVGLKALEFLSENPFANLVAVGSVSSGKLAIRTRKYQMGINANYEFLSPRHNIYGFMAEKSNDQFIGRWPYWKGEWEVFNKHTNYDAFLLTLK